MSAYLEVKKLKATVYHPETKCAGYKIKRTLVSQLGLCVADNPRNLDQYVQPLTFVNNCQAHRSIITSYLFVHTFKNYPGLTNSDSASFLLNEAYKGAGKKPPRTQLLEMLADMKRTVSTSLQEIRQHYKRHFDTNVKRSS